MRRFLLLPLVLGLAACGGKEKSPATQPAPTPSSTASSNANRSGVAVAVSVRPAAMVDWPNFYTATGTIRARMATPVAARLMGYATQVAAQAGQRVAQGQLLVTIETRELDSLVGRAEAGRAEVQSALPEADSAIAAARANLELAQTTYNRMKDLLEKKSISPQEFDEAAARWKAAQSALAMAQAKRTQLDSRLRQTEEEVRAANIQRSFTRVVAPFAGILVSRQVEPGALVTPGATLFVLEREGPMRLEATVEENLLAGLRVGGPAQVLLPLTPTDGLNPPVEETIPATIGEIVPLVDAAARTGTVKLDLPPQVKARSGQYARALFARPARRALAVPASAILRQGQVESLFVAERGVARLRLVTLGPAQAGNVEVLSGLSEGEAVIAPVPAGLLDGTPIRATAGGNQ